MTARIVQIVSAQSEATRLQDVILAVVDEVRSAERRHSPINSPHEGYAVIAEELDELWDHVRANTGRSDEAMYEAIQIAAMGVRFVLNLARHG